MKNTEFCYWLQGYFELRDEPWNITPKMIVTIKRHIELVRKVDGKLDEFVAWLEGILDACDPDESLSTHIESKIKTRLGQKFKHEIDLSYGGDLDELNQIHNQGSLPSPLPFRPEKDTLYRC